MATGYVVDSYLLLEPSLRLRAIVGRFATSGALEATPCTVSAISSRRDPSGTGPVSNDGSHTYQFS